MPRTPARRGFTLIELLVVIAIIGILISLLFPALQAAREAARRTQCANNLKNIGLALQNYHDIYKTFPMGAMHAGGNPASGMRGPVLGPSWWFGTLPFLERRNIYDDIMAGTRAGGWLDLTTANSTGADFCARNVNANIAGRPLDTLTPDYMRCPASPIPEMETQTGTILMPTYTGIAGGTDIALDTNPGPWVYLQKWGIPATELIYRNKYYCRTVDEGFVMESGMLPPCRHIKLADCTDGASNTMIVGEQSDWLRDVDRTISTKYHGDPGWNLDPSMSQTTIADNRGGWLSGTSEFLTVERLHLNRAPAIADWTAHLFNVTTVRYKPNAKDVLAPPGTPATGTRIRAPGCSEVHEAGRGVNNPLQSAHDGGVMTAFVDGSTQFIISSTDLAVLLRISIRDDGQKVRLD